MTSQVAVTGFKFKETTDGDRLQTVKRILPVDMRMVNFVDGEGKEQNRLVVILRGKKGGVKCYNFLPKVGNSYLITEATEWFTKAVEDKMKEEDGVASV